MLATSGVEQVWVGVIVLIIGGLGSLIVRAFVQTFGKRQTEKRDAASMAEFFFDTPENPRTRIPAKKGWTTQVNETLTSLQTGIGEVATSVKTVNDNVAALGGAILQEQQRLKDEKETP